MMEDTKIKAEAMAQYIRHKKEFENERHVNCYK